MSYLVTTGWFGLHSNYSEKQQKFLTLPTPAAIRLIMKNSVQI